jgi:hypothetical protein
VRRNLEVLFACRNPGTPMKLLLGTIAVTIGIVAAAPGASAQANRTFVSGRGSDASPCNPVAPCRSFARALAQTNSAGEIVVLDSAGYGPLTISKSISIVSPDGVYAGITVPSGDTGITINAGENDTVTLRGLTLDGNAVGSNGVVMNSGATLQVINCIIRGFTLTGILVSSQTSGEMSVLVSGSYFLDNHAGNAVGLKLLQSSAAGLTAAIDRVVFHQNDNGIVASTAGAGGFLVAAITGSEISSSLGEAIGVHRNGAVPHIDVKNTSLALNPTGILVDGGTVALSGSTLAANAQAVDFATLGGIVYTAGNNDFVDNATDVYNGSLTALPLK